MNQTKLESLIEQTLSTISGFFLSLAVWIFVIVPIWNIQVSMAQNVNITLVFTILSIVRGYFWRRLFNANIPKTIAARISKIWNF
jgi:uncharacterized membrane protein